jgi:hypothetical protein
LINGELLEKKLTKVLAERVTFVTNGTGGNDDTQVLKLVSEVCYGSRDGRTVRAGKYLIETIEKHCNDAGLACNLFEFGARKAPAESGAVLEIIERMKEITVFAAGVVMPQFNQDG